MIRADAQGFQEAVEAIAQAEIDGFEFQFARFDLGKIEDGVDQTEQRLPRGFRHAEILALLGVEGSFQHEVGHADDAVHGRADLVAHVGEELAFRRVRALGFQAGGPRAAFGLHEGVQRIVQPHRLFPAFADVRGDQTDRGGGFERQRAEREL